MKLTEYCQQLLLPYLHSTKIAIDATIGNGHDTLFLANNLPLNSLLLGFDIQEIALQKTQEKLLKSRLKNYQLFHSCHSEIKKVINAQQIIEADLIMFNLGYLPQADKTITTLWKTTHSALNQSIEILSLTGVISLMVYPGHAEGKIESSKIKLWLESIPKNFECLKIEKYPVNEINPYLLLITRRH